MAVFKLRSPGKRVAVNFFFDGALSYQVLVDGREAVAPSPLGLVTGGGDFCRDLVFKGELRSRLDYGYRIPAFKKAECTDHANCLALSFEKGGAEILAEARAYDDGAAFRLTLKGSGPVQITKEASAFNVPRGAGEIYAQKHLWSYEDHYHPVPKEELWQNVYAFPLLLKLEGEYWALYAEAPVYGGDYGGAVLRSFKENPSSLGLARSPDQLKPVEGNLPFSTPWRAVIAGSLNDIVRSNLLENLNPPSIVKDPSYIKPGKLAWHWMVENNGAGDPKRMRDYVDYAAEMGFPYSLVDGGWPGNTDIPSLVKYAGEKNVGIWIWEHSSALRDPAEAEEKLKLWASWGVAGVKIDFFESDSQERIAQYGMLAVLADKYRLMLNFHGCSKPTGTSRLWPHVLSYEGVMGGEYLQNFSTYLPGGPDAAHNCTLPFTRNAVGPMDYTPVIYESYITGTTDAHQTALTVVFTSYAMHIAEKPEIVLSHPCRPFLEKVPTVWDDTILLEGAPASHVTMARRSAGEWYIAGICARRPRWAEFSFDFLNPVLDYSAELYADDISGDLPFDQAAGALPDADEKICAGLMASFSRKCAHQHDVHKVRTEKFPVKFGDKFRVPLSVNGGFALRLSPK
ncbi:MAG: glycoside hydrolase family 97 protein [Treponema sp.]|jgi:alpha-glucosidase|nr:glycoside hydrolase family 97 protein [Treponema sp.]